MDVNAAVIRRPVIADVQKMDFNPSTIAHVTAYTKCVDLLIQHSKEIGRPLHVLDIGCGDMHVLRALWNGSRVKKSTVLASYTGYDVYCQEIPVGKNTPGVILNFEYCDFNADYILPENIDFVIALEFIEHIEYLAGMRLLATVHNSLVAGGRLLLSTPNATMHNKDVYHIYEYEIEELLCELQALGFSTQCWGHNIHLKDLQHAILDHPEHSETLEILRNKFSNNFYRVIASSLFPEYSQEIVVLATK